MLRREDYDKLYYQKHRRQSQQSYQRRKKKLQRYNQENRGRRALYAKQYRDEHITVLTKKVEQYYQQNREKMKIYRLKYRKRINKQRRDRVHRDINFRLACNLRSRLSTAVTSAQKTGSAVRDLGCTILEVKSHLEKQFQSRMSWNNYGNGEDTWNIDHIIPLMSFNLSDRRQFIRAVNYKNLQPLWDKDNKSKGCKPFRRKNR